MSEDEVLFHADNVRLEPHGVDGSLRVGSRTLRFGVEHAFAYPNILLHAIAVNEAGVKYLYCQLDAAAGDDDDGGGVDRATSSVVERLQNGHAANGDDNDNDDDEAESAANVTELRFTGLSEEQLAACYEAMSRAAALNPDADVDADSFFGGLLGAGDADMLAAWDAKLDVPDDEFDADEAAEPRFDDADETAAGRTTDHDESGTPKKTRTAE